MARLQANFFFKHAVEMAGEPSDHVSLPARMVTA